MHGLYPMLLGSRWDDVRGDVRRLHGEDGASMATGLFRIEHGRRLGVRTILRLMGMPEEAIEVPTRLVVERTDGRETWRRVFAGHELVTTQSAASNERLAEQFGLLEFQLRLQVIRGGIEFVQTSAALRVGAARIRIPKWLAPRLVAHEWNADEGSGVQVSVSVDAPLLGLLISYVGGIEVSRNAT